MTYRFAPPVAPDVDAALAAYSPLVRSLLANRGITTEAAAREFLSPSYDTHRHDPFLMTDMEKAVERVLRAIKDGERVAIWSDYDADGVPGGVLLHDFFTAVGFTNFENYIPHRNDEGYGLNTAGLDALAERGATLVISIDCGITDIAAVAHARTRGMDVIITDHHEAPPELPPAYAILDPKRDEAYPFRELCGSGVIWKLVEGLIARGNFALSAGREKWWLDMVGLATLSDMVPLVGENRVLARYGLLVMQKSRRPGLTQLFRLLRLNPRNLSEDDIGFSIAPRINAASRMGSSDFAFRALATTDAEDAALAVTHLDRVNNERKGVVAAMVKDMKRRLAERAEAPVIVMGHAEWRPSLLGLAANTLMGEYRRPVFLWGRDGRNIIKGSCRSDGSVSVVALMRDMGDTLLDFGGHHASGGFSIRDEHIHHFPDRVVSSYESVRGAAVDSTVFVDAPLALTDVTPALFRDIATLSPFGEGNPKPLFRFASAVPRSVERFGKAKEHTRAVFDGARGTLEAMAFFTAPDEFTADLVPGKAVDLIAHVEQSFFMNRVQLRLRIVDAL